VLVLPATVVTLTKLGVSQANVFFINRERSPAGQVAANALALALGLGLLSVAATWLLRDVSFVRATLKSVPTWAVAAALARVPLLLVDNYIYGVLQAIGRFDVYNKRLLLGESLRLSLVIALVGVLNLRLPAAVLLYVLVTLVNVTYLLTRLRREMTLAHRVDTRLLRGQLDFGFRSYVQTVTTHLLLRIDIYMVAYFLGAAETAFYALALRFTELVLEFPQAIGLVLYPRLTALSDKDMHRLTAQASRRTLLITAPCAAVLGLLGPYVIVLWYGRPYAPAGGPLPWAAFGVVMWSFFIILTRDFTSRGRQRTNIAAGLLALVGNVALNALLIPRRGIVGAAVATAVSYSGAALVLLARFSAESRLSPFEAVVPRWDDVRYVSEKSRSMLVRLWRRGKGAEHRGAE